MPKKKNYGGQDQEFIPAGNGDASGEYADDNGSNRHFTNFAKPVDNEAKQDDIDKKAKEVSRDDIDKKEYVEKFKNYIADKVPRLKGEKIDNLHEILEQANSRNVKIVADYFAKTGTKIVYRKNGFAYYDPNENSILYGECDFEIEKEKSWQHPGIAIFHEAGHGIDYTSNNKKHTLSFTVVDEKYNMTLNDSVRKEAKDLVGKMKRNDFVEYFKKKTKPAIYEEELEKVCNEAGISKEKYKEFDIKFEENESEIKKIVSEKVRERGLMQKWYNNEINKVEFFQSREQLYKEVMNDFFPNAMKSIVNKHKEIKEKIQKGTEYRWANSFGTLSDVVQGVNSWPYGTLGPGHSASYFKSAPYLLGNEFFAGAFAAIAMNPEEEKVLREYMPRSMEILDNLLKNYVEGK